MDISMGDACVRGRFDHLTDALVPIPEDSDKNFDEHLLNDGGQNAQR